MAVNVAAAQAPAADEADAQDPSPTAVDPTLTTAT
jgi:hypothetical protein